MDAGTVVSLISILTFLFGIAVYVAKLAFRFRRLEKQADHRKEDTKIILSSLLACLDGLHQQGANGPVTKAKEDLEKYIVESR
jgi:hypothetical protein